jgi:hypothetical protein
MKCKALATEFGARHGRYIPFETLQTGEDFEEKVHRTQDGASTAARAAHLTVYDIFSDGYPSSDSFFMYNRRADTL